MKLSTFLKGVLDTPEVKGLLKGTGIDTDRLISVINTKGHNIAIVKQPQPVTKNRKAKVKSS
jgi:hypothetical protein